MQGISRHRTPPLEGGAADPIAAARQHHSSREAFIPLGSPYVGQAVFGELVFESDVLC
jgi:hypothetical protein